MVFDNLKLVIPFVLMLCIGNSTLLSRQTGQDDKKSTTGLPLVQISLGGELDQNVQNEEQDPMLYGPVKDNGARNVVWRSSQLGKGVEIEGLAMGFTKKITHVVYEGKQRCLVRTGDSEDGRRPGSDDSCPCAASFDTKIHR